MKKISLTPYVITLLVGLLCIGIAVVSVGVIKEISGVISSEQPLQFVSLEDSIDATINNVVHIRNNTGQWQGSGVLIAPDLVLTARHVAEDGKDFEVKTNDGRIYKAERAITSKKYDLGFIKLRDKLPCTTVIGDLRNCRLGQSIYVIGSPFGDVNQNSVTAGIISSLSRQLEAFGCPEKYGWSVSFQSDSGVEPGNSGGPLYTLDGKVIGIVVGKWDDAIAYAIPAKLVANDCQVIQLMFLMDEYQKEEVEEWKRAYAELKVRINGLGIGIGILDERTCELERKLEDKNE